ncbi:transglutaminase-like putative cysteine protease [Rhodovulum sulfidophilum]|uniref:transglutaminase family protein n=1 Tax=Rhodovulum sulfidophilum TaxID=35806 RepID=UPI0005A8B348|nr:transglutaminase family protein [Rhodovulum sulfidophilum]ANB35506.1 transglutaminase [Rhodovulum sulfidophilum DSM 1374]ANB39326.1 transglutaminase [Rhodovulum sulfidophilum]MCW2303545.1 transglutaminase-like putative cysteine protease [Rhodovulum sulfidophilum]
MPSVTILHATDYRYRTEVPLGAHRLMLRPRETRDLSLTSFELEITPEARIDWSNDVAGNAVATAQFDRTTTMLSIRARTRLELRAPVWPVFPIAAAAASYPFAYSPDDWTDLGALAMPQYADDTGRLSKWVERFVMSRPTDTLSLLKDVSNGITALISYQSRETEGTQGPLETLDRGWGSCRDFAVLLAEAVRTLGFGARLVSGYLFDPDGDRTGAAATGSTHAWVEIFVPGAGWVAFDPTNRAMGSANLIPVAVARRIAQVSPVSGSFHGRPSDLLALNVEVSVCQDGASR